MAEVLTGRATRRGFSTREDFHGIDQSDFERGIDPAVQLEVEEGDLGVDRAGGRTRRGAVYYCFFSLGGDVKARGQNDVPATPVGGSVLELRDGDAGPTTGEFHPDAKFCSRRRVALAL